jgi:hypothetical protein
MVQNHNVIHVQCFLQEYVGNPMSHVLTLTRHLCNNMDIIPQKWKISQVRLSG